MQIFFWNSFILRCRLGKTCGSNTSNRVGWFWFVLRVFYLTTDSDLDSKVELMFCSVLGSCPRRKLNPKLPNIYFSGQFISNFRVFPCLKKLEHAREFCRHSSGTKKKQFFFFSGTSMEILFSWSCFWAALRITHYHLHCRLFQFGWNMEGDMFPIQPRWLQEPWAYFLTEMTFEIFVKETKNLKLAAYNLKTAHLRPNSHWTRHATRTQIGMFFLSCCLRAVWTLPMMKIGPICLRYVVRCTPPPVWIRPQGSSREKHTLQFSRNNCSFFCGAVVTGPQKAPGKQTGHIVANESVHTAYKQIKGITYTCWRF